MVQTFHRDRLTWLAYILLAFYGYFLNIFGPITPFLKEEMGLTYTVSSLHFTAFALGILLVGAGGHLLIRRIGRWRAFWLGAFGMSLGAVGLVLGRSPLVTIGASFFMGWIGSLILVLVSAVLSDLHGNLRAVALSEANVLASLIAAAAPLLVGWCAPLPGGWRLALGVGAFAPLLLWTWFRGARAEAALSDREETPSTHSRLPLRFWVYWLTLVLAVAVEFCMVFWSADYLETGLGMPKAGAAQAVSLFLAAMLVGRWAASRLVGRFPVRSVVLGFVLVAGAGFALYWSAGTVAAALAGLFVTGLGVAGLYPLILSLALGSAEGNTTQAGARATLASGTAILALPLALGGLADRVGIRPAYGVVAVLLLGVLGIMLAKREEKKVNVTKIKY